MMIYVFVKTRAEIAERVIGYIVPKRYFETPRGFEVTMIKPSCQITLHHRLSFLGTIMDAPGQTKGQRRLG
jgi:hypothetical protein